MDTVYDSVLWRAPYRKYLPTLVGAGVGSVLSAIAAGRKAYRQVQADNSFKFPTWSERPVVRRARMPRRFTMKRRLPSGRRYRRRYSRMKLGKTLGEGWPTRLVRTSGPLGLSIAAGVTSFSSTDILLNIVQTSDLVAAYKCYRIRKVVLHLVPRVDYGNSGVANNFQAMVAASCDPEDNAAPTSITQITAYENSYQKFVTAGDRFTYTFYPKVVNAVGNSGAAAYVGTYGLNPWLQLNATGIVIPHQSIKIGIHTSASTTVQFNLFYEIHFDVKGLP